MSDVRCSTVGCSLLCIAFCLEHSRYVCAEHLNNHLDGDCDIYTPNNFTRSILERLKQLNQCKMKETKFALEEMRQKIQVYRNQINELSKKYNQFIQTLNKQILDQKNCLISVLRSNPRDAIEQLVTILNRPLPEIPRYPPLTKVLMHIFESSLSPKVRQIVSEPFVYSLYQDMRAQEPQLLRNGSWYIGNWSCDGERHGSGVQLWPNGCVYEGYWKNGMRHGTGRLVYTDGRVYCGKWSNGKRHGTGKELYPNGDSYDGEWANDRKHGKGKSLSLDGQYYDGKWSNGYRHGNGRLEWPNVGSYQGRFINDQRLPTDAVLPQPANVDEQDIKGSIWSRLNSFGSIPLRISS